MLFSFSMGLFFAKLSLQEVEDMENTAICISKNIGYSGFVTMLNTDI